MSNPGDYIKIRKVKALGGRAKKEALRQELNENDLVLVEGFINSLPEWRVTPIKGHPTEFLQKHYLKN